jgi:3-oxoacyl-[acyl-carrier-protein] synthase II
MSRPRIVVTGIGGVTPLGPNLAETWLRLVRGEHGIRPVTVFPDAGYRSHRAGECTLPPVPGRFDARALLRLPRASRLLLPAAAEALEMAALPAHDGLALSFSTTAGGMNFGEEFLRELTASHRARFARIARYHPQQQLLDLQEALAFRAGATFLVANSCASGANSIGHALDWLQAGRGEVALAGGFEALCELVFAGFDCLQAQTTGVCRPFDQGRSGLLLGEAAGCLVLETESHARKRGAAPLAVLAGYGHSTDNHHLTQPAPTGAALVRALRDACTRAGIAPGDIDYVNAHGTATPANDPAEQNAYVEVFGDALAAGRPQIRSTKAAIGHTLGAAGAIEAIFAVKSLQSGTLPPQLGLEQPLPGMEQSLAGTLPATGARYVASTNLGFGGSNAALIFAAP